ncbi:Alkylphosphonate utilization operon protein PhnA [Indibacter alkaliphilus LW1]|uniref:Alkylphosphonate utilization operon protein PhnA n=1 Tax=Indibacter alkaliphilus (strain CCUG 57479 / KCTC 22604 / LW1) TaxID=1189612 RepID=S2DY75_INDAL|nr:zinc ribbon domain-containing protein YjdM [Indibacter alkaliphilus]EOZ97066.1 Alkylphosphonate utilization operon protein PhnA [Indibacter alkaliphilus LW1]
MKTLPPCPSCGSLYAYALENSLVCPECSFEWEPTGEETAGNFIKDANGNVLADGDTVIVIKDLPVKGAPKPIKSGTKVKNIRLAEGDHNIDCKIDGFGSMALKSEFVRKA